MEMQKSYMVLSSSRRKILYRNSHDRQKCNNHGLSKVEGKSVLSGELFLKSQVLQDGRGKRGRWVETMKRVLERPSGGGGAPSRKQGHKAAVVPPPFSPLHSENPKGSIAELLSQGEGEKAPP